MDHQVIIVGSGPAGSACAKALKEEDIDVLVIEQDTLPRNKICSGVLFGQTQVLLEKYFGSLPPEHVYCDPKIINAADIREWSPESGYTPYVWELDKDGQTFPTRYYNIWRKKFDHWLLKQSQAAFLDQIVFKGCKQDDDAVTVRILNKNKTRIESKTKDGQRDKLTCSYLIGADGGTSMVRKIIQPDWTGQGQEVVIFQTYNHFTDKGKLEDGHWTVFFKPEIGEILCCVHPKDKFLTLCVGGVKGRNLLESMAAFKQFLSDKFGVVFGEEERVEGCKMRMAPPNHGSGRVLLTGEAAGLIYLNGEGISVALDAGYRCGKAVAGALRENKNAVELYRESTGDIINHMNHCMENLHFLAQ
ncbi:MAG: NAD(P)/FAD-dependent oxidoreductase [Deltaproteobacteria bacterium]|nr:NAD(P)/FAD-dependent oxidoreductase [Deltaproteobacteria bacterium]